MALRNHSIKRAELTLPDLDFTNVQAPLGSHTVFLVDFGRADTNSPPCGQERQHRGRRQQLGPVEQEERRRVTEELQRLAASVPRRPEVEQRSEGVHGN